jgi:hypothetical protein
VGETEMDKSCETCADGHYSLCVCQRCLPQSWWYADRTVVVAVYGVLFLDWNPGTGDNQSKPFQGVSWGQYSCIPLLISSQSDSRVVLGYDGVDMDEGRSTTTKTI